MSPYIEVLGLVQALVEFVSGPVGSRGFDYSQFTDMVGKTEGKIYEQLSTRHFLCFGNFFVCLHVNIPSKIFWNRFSQ